MTDLSERRGRVAGLFDELAPAYDQGGVPFFALIGRRLVELAGARQGDRALDVGAGRGAVTFALLDAVGAHGHVTAVDLSPRMAEHLRADAAARGVPNLDVLVGEAIPGVLDAASFDVVTASLVLFFDPDPAGTLRHWLALGRPGGRLGLTTFGPADNAWRRAEAAVLEYAPPAMLDARTSGASGPFSSSAALDALVAASGGVDVVSREEPLHVALPDADAWRAWTMTVGMRQFWAHVPEHRVPDVMARAGAALEADRRPDGLLHLTQTVRYTTAVVP